MPSVMVEYAFSEPISDEQLGKMSERFDPCLEIRNGAWVRTSLSKDRKRMVCEFEAPDADSVRDALRSAGLTFERVWPAQVFAVESYPSHLAKLEEVRAKSTSG